MECIVSEEQFFEFSDIKSSISGFIVSCNDELAFIKGWINSNGVETSLKLVNINLSVSWNIEYREGVNNVEVCSVTKIDFGGFNLLFQVALLFKRMDKFILLIDW